MSIFYLVYAMMVMALAEAGLYLLCGLAVAAFLYLFFRYLKEM